jgi:hypothetical protein
MSNMLNKKEFPPLPSQARRKSRPTKKRRKGSPTTAQRAQATSLNDLPDELIVGILDYLPGIDLRHFQLLTLASLSLVNRRFNHIVADRLYAAYDSFFCTPYPFLRTVMSNPDLASHIKSISFNYGLEVHEERGLYVPSISDRQLIKDSLKGLHMPKFDWKLWASECNDRHVDQELIYATILLYTPNVTRLEIDDGVPIKTPGRLPWWLHNFRKIVNGVDFGRAHRFQQLRSIRVDVSYLRLRHLAPLFREELQRLFPSRASLIDELHMEMSFVEDDILEVLISGINKLKVFQYWSSTDQYMPNGQYSDDYWGTSAQEGYEPYNLDHASNSWLR